MMRRGVKKRLGIRRKKRGKERGRVKTGEEGMKKTMRGEEGGDEEKKRKTREREQEVRRRMGKVGGKGS